MNSYLSTKRMAAVAIFTVAMFAPAPAPAQPAKASAGGSLPYQLEIQDGALTQPDGKNTEANLENVVERLRELEHLRDGAPPNIVLSPDLPRILIANLKLGSATLPQELEALRVASGERFVWSAGDSTSPSYAVVDPATGLPIAPAPGGGADASGPPLYVLRPAPETGRSLLRVEAFSLAGYFESRKKSNDEAEYRKMVDEEIQQLRRIIEETVAAYADMNRKMNRGEASSMATPSLRFHAGANLLIVTGEIGAVEIASKVITALPHVQRSGGNVTGMGMPGMPGPAAEAFKSRYGIYPQPGAGAPGGLPVAR